MSDFYTTVEERFRDWNYGHPLILAGFIRAMKPEVVVEVGSYRGFAACHMAKALQENNNGRLHCIDNWTLTEHVERYGDPRAHFEENIKACGVDGWIELHQGHSSDPFMWPDKVDFCYIDGWHSYDQAYHDYFMAKKRGATFIAFDDTENCVGPRILFDALRRSNSKDEWDFLDIHSDNGLSIMVKKQPKRPITFSQELPFPNPGVDLRPLSLEQQKEHFEEAALTTEINYSEIFNQTEYDMKL